MSFVIGRLNVQSCFEDYPLQAISGISFAKKHSDVRVDDVLNALALLDSSVRLTDTQKLIFRVDDSAQSGDRVSGALVDLLRQRAEEDSRAKRDPEFLIKFVKFITGYGYVPHSNLRMTVEFAAFHDPETVTHRTSNEVTRMSDDALPMAHTCDMTLKLPYTAYDGNPEKLAQKLDMALMTLTSFNMV